MKRLLLIFFPFMLIFSMIFASCSTQSVVVPVKMATVTPLMSVVSPTRIPSATNAALPGDDVWDRITSRQKIVVGTSLDYPPFASMDARFHATGFDIALIQEIGRRLKIPVEIQNFTFEGLPDALHLNQIDLAVAAISITPERASRASFSSIYYVNQTAILAKNGSRVVAITDFKQLAGYRVGVQRGTTYQQMVQHLLVDTRLMGADKMLSYMQSDEAVRDLLANRVDVVVLGQATASYYGTQPNLRVVGQGFDPQNLAVAMRLGTPRLKAEIDRVMDDMLTDGTILGFIQQYIQSDVTTDLPTAIATMQVTPTPFPPVPTATEPVCVNGMKFVSDVTFGDNNMQNPPFIKAGTGFIKTWRVENSGTCTWTPNYHLVYAYGNLPAAQMGGQPLGIPVNVVPGQLVDLSVTLVAPPALSTYQGFWQIETDTGNRFGQTIWVAITTIDNQETPIATGQPSGNACVVTKTSPADAVQVRSGFDTVWTVQNTSGTDWKVASVDYQYLSGTKMQEKDQYDFTQTIKKGETGKIIVDMIAPSKPGLYSANWAIISGNKTLCVLSVTVTVISK